MRAASPRFSAARARRSGAARTRRRLPRRFARREAPMANPAPGYANKPEHRVDLLPESRRGRVTFARAVIADSGEAGCLGGKGGRAGFFFPPKKIPLGPFWSAPRQNPFPLQGDRLFLRHQGRG